MIVIDKKTQRTKDENGFLHVALSNISKETVNPYYGYEVPNFESFGLDPKKIYYVYRKGEELSKGAKTFNNMPLLRGHYEVTPIEGQKEHVVGSLGSECQFNAPYLQNSLCITDQEAIDSIENGKRVELSAGYMYDPIIQKGEFEGTAYDIIMTNIRCNHVALVEEGRAGPDVLVADKNINLDEVKNMKLSKEQKEKLLRFVCDEDISVKKAEELLSGIVEEITEHLGKADNEGDEPKANDEDPTPPNTDEPSKESTNDEDNETAAKRLLALVESMEGISPEDKKRLGDEIANITLEVKNEESPVDDKACKDEPATEDSTPSKDSEKPTKEETKTMDTALIVKDAENKAIARIQGIYKAVDEVKPLVGKLDPMAYDSAEAVYLEACKLANVKATKETARDVALALALQGNESKNIQPVFDSTFKSRFA